MITTTIQNNSGKQKEGKKNKILKEVMKDKDMDRNDLYIGVKTLLESESSQIHLSQQKLYTLFSVALQHLVYLSTKDPGNYLVRIESSFLAEKLANKAKDESSRKFMEKLIVSRKLKYKDSTFYLDYFHISSWGLTSSFTKNQIKSALIVKDSYNKPLNELPLHEINNNFDFNYHTSLKDIVKLIVIIAYEEKFEGFTNIKFPFVTSNNENDNAVNGVTLAANLSLNFDEESSENDNNNIGT
ncbi:MAG: hypothetical protein HQK51_20145 [Oligoflexia bacterium]|nr:hypothetical protein [Oligoflexia bacterium]